MENTQATKQTSGLSSRSLICSACLNYKAQITYLQQTLERKNKELDALTYVWCSGGCEGGAARYTDDEITEEIVALAERNTKRLRAWFENHKIKSSRKA